MWLALIAGRMKATLGQGEDHEEPEESNDDDAIAGLFGEAPLH